MFHLIMYGLFVCVMMAHSQPVHEDWPWKEKHSGNWSREEQPTTKALYSKIEKERSEFQETNRAIMEDINKLKIKNQKLEDNHNKLKKDKKQIKKLIAESRILRDENWELNEEIQNFQETIKELAEELLQLRETTPIDQPSTTVHKPTTTVNQVHSVQPPESD